jgi:hypothetical protein
MEGKLLQFISPEDLRVPDDILQLNGRDISFVNKIRYLGVTFDRRMTWRHHIKRNLAKALRTYGGTYSLFKSGRLNTNTKFAFYKALFMSVMTYACSTWEYAADARLLKWQHL